MKVCLVIVVIYTTLIWTFIEVFFKVIDGNVFALVPSVVLLFTFLMLTKFVIWVCNLQRLAEMSNVFNNALYILKKAKANNAPKLEAFIQILTLPPDDFQQKYM